MKKVIDAKTGKVQVVFNEYKLEGSTACPECGRPFKDYDIKNLGTRGKISCVKCGAKLIK